MLDVCIWSLTTYPPLVIEAVSRPLVCDRWFRGRGATESLIYFVTSRSSCLCPGRLDEGPCTDELIYCCIRVAEFGQCSGREFRVVCFPSYVTRRWIETVETPLVRSEEAWISAGKA